MSIYFGDFARCTIFDGQFTNPSLIYLVLNCLRMEVCILFIVDCFCKYLMLKAPASFPLPFQFFFWKPCCCIFFRLTCCLLIIMLLFLSLYLSGILKYFWCFANGESLLRPLTSIQDELACIVYETDYSQLLCCLCWGAGQVDHRCMSMDSGLQYSVLSLVLWKINCFQDHWDGEFWVVCCHSWGFITNWIFAIRTGVSQSLVIPME